MFEMTMTVDLSGVEDTLQKRFGGGSEAQRLWSETVFHGSTDYMPKVDGTFINESIAASTPLFKHGELLYPGPYAHYLWVGELYVDRDTGSAWAGKGKTKVPAGKDLTFNQEANPQAGAHWVDRAANDHKPEWIETMQNAIRKGAV